MFLTLKVQNPAILPRRPTHAKIMVKYGGLGSGEDRPPGEDGRILRFKGKNVHLVQATAQFSQSGAHMQARGSKWPLKSVNLPNLDITEGI